MVKKINIKHKHLKLILLTFIALSILCYFFPYVHDDWAWGSSIGQNRLNSGFINYGGRYFGYLIVMIMTRCKVLAALLMGGTLTGIAVCVKRLVGSWWTFGASLILIFLLPKEVFAQSISWISGFANYATTTLIVLIFLNILKDIVIDGRRERSPTIFLMPIIGFAGSLILENITVYLAIMSIIAQVYLVIKERRVSRSLVLFTIGTIIGAAWMFSNPAYRNVLSGEDNYRSITTSVMGLIWRAKANYMDEVHIYGLFKNITISALLLFGGIFVFASSKIKKKSALISISIFSAYTIYAIISEVIIGEINKPNTLRNIEGILSLIALGSLIIFSIAISKKNTVLRKTFGILWCSFLIILGPLLFITPIGPRNFLTSDLLLITTGLLFWNEALGCLDKNNKAYQSFAQVGKKIEIIIAISVWVIFTGIFIYITRADNLRLQNIKNQIDEGSQTVTIKPLPFEQLMWCPTPRNDIFKERYKLFYDLPEDTKIIVDE